MKKGMSIRTMSRILFSLLIPLTILLGCAGVYQVGAAYTAERRQTEERFELELQRTEEELLRPESYMSSLLMQSEAVQKLNSPASELEHYTSKWEIYQGFSSYLTQDPNVLVLALLAAVAVVAVVAYYLIWKRRLLQPLQVLKQTMENIRSGNLQSRALDPRAGSELTEINDAFNHMMDNIRAGIEKVCGRSPFKGKAGETVFCGRWEIRL